MAPSNRRPETHRQTLGDLRPGPPQDDTTPYPATARTIAAEAWNHIIQIMRSAKDEKVRLEAAKLGAGLETPKAGRRPKATGATDVDLTGGDRQALASHLLAKSREAADHADAPASRLYATAAREVMAIKVDTGSDDLAQLFAQIDASLGERGERGERGEPSVAAHGPTANGPTGNGHAPAPDDG